MSSRSENSAFHQTCTNTLFGVLAPPPFAVSRAWNIPKRYLIRSYFEPRVSDRSVSYPQVTQFYIVKREAAPFRRGDSQLITSVKRVRVANEPPLGGAGRS